MDLRSTKDLPFLNIVESFQVNINIGWPCLGSVIHTEVGVKGQIVHVKPFWLGCCGSRVWEQVLCGCKVPIRLRMA